MLSCFIGLSVAPGGYRGPLRGTNVSEQSSHIRLDQFLKLADVAQSGGEAKVLIKAGEVMVNGEIETRRKRKLIPGDTVKVDGCEMEVILD